MQFCGKFVPYLQNICLIFAKIMTNDSIKYKVNILIAIIVFLLLCMIFMAQGYNDFYKEAYDNCIREMDACNYERIKAQAELLKHKQ